MAVTTFIPEVWSARILDKLESNLVYVNLMNRDYEGEITAYGDTVHIASYGDVTIKDYARGTDIAAPEDLSTTDQTLTIDQMKYYNFAVDDVDKAQMRTDLLDRYAARAGYGLSKVADGYASGLLAAGTLVTTQSATDKFGNDTKPIELTQPSQAYDMLVDLQILLDDMDIPRNGRWVVVPNAFKGLMEKDDRFVKTGSAQAENRLARGFAGSAAGFDIFTSTLVPNTSGSKYKIIASTNRAGTFAEQLLETEAYRPEKRFADAIKGLHVYGAKVVRPDEVAVATVNFTAAA